MELLLVLLLWAGPQDPAQPADPPSDTEKVQQTSYAIGYNLGRSFSDDQIELDLDFFMDGLVTAMNKGEAKFTEQEMAQIMRAFQAEVSAKRRAAKAESMQVNLEKAQAFMEANKSNEGVQVLESGLQYKILEHGDGASPTEQQQVTIHYEGKVAQGSVFDSSYQKGQPLTMPVNGFIPGMIEALQMMKVGSKWELYIPPNLGYGPAGGGNVIPPNAALVFTVELLEVGSGQDVKPVENPQ